MSLTQLKHEAALLPPEERRALIAFLVALQIDQDEPFRQQLTAKIDDPDPTHWMELDALRKRYEPKSKFS